jgi:hypothetical protein
MIALLLIGNIGFQDMINPNSHWVGHIGPTLI